MIHLQPVFAQVGTGARAKIDYSTQIGFRAYLDCETLMKWVDDWHGGRGRWLQEARQDILNFASETGVQLSDAQVGIITRRFGSEDGPQTFNYDVLSHDEAIGLSALVGMWSGDRGQDLQADFLTRQAGDQAAVAEGRQPSYLEDRD